MKKFYITFCFLTILTFIAPAYASTPVLIGEYSDWVAYSYKDSNGIVCYMASSPKKDEGKYTQRGDIYTIVTHRPKEKTFNVVNFVAGYDFKQGSKITVKIGNTTIDKFFTDQDKAWTLSEKIDTQVVEAMKKGDRMIVEGTSSRGTKTKDTYSLRGFMAAHKAITAKCK